MKIYMKENSPFWWYDFMVNGQRYRGSTKRTTKAEANRVLHEEYRKVMNRQQFGEKPEITVDEAFQRVIKGASGKTKESYDLARRKWIGDGKFADRWHLPPGMMLHELTDEHLEDHIEARRDEGLRANSINVEIRVLKIVHRAHAKRYKVNDELEFKLVKGFVKTRFLTRDEEAAVETLLRLKDGESAQKALDLMIFLRDSGARISEALNANWRDLNLKKGLFEVYRIKTDSLSLLPLTPRVIAMLKAKKDAGEKKPFMEMSRAIKVLRAAIDKVANDDPRIIHQRGRATIHTLRDTYGSHLVQNGLSLHELAKLLGHTTAAMSAKYAHLEGRDVAEKARELMSA